MSNFLLPPNPSEAFPGDDGDVLFTPSYWASQIQFWSKSMPSGSHRLGHTLLQETAACLLGGHGIPSQVALCAFNRLQEDGLLRVGANENAIMDALARPLDVDRGRSVRYRFARTKGAYLCSLVKQWADPSPDMAGRDLRNWLLQFDGIGLKTASWVVRNWSDCDDVAILDIHIFRAGVLAGFFQLADRIDRDYLRLEQAFIDFARRINARPSVLDAIMWAQMRQAGPLAHAAMNRYSKGDEQRTKQYQTGRTSCQVAAEGTRAGVAAAA